MPRLEQLEQSNVQYGTNCTMVFQSNDGSFSVAVRVRKLAYKWEVIATESHARESRAMYPRQRAVGQFALTLELKGYNEFHQLMDFMRSYIYSWRYGSKPAMLVTMAVRDFSRRCVPIKGMSIGDHIGSMVFLPTIVFESAHDPLDPTILSLAQASSYDLAGTETDVKNFFYPFSRASQDTNVRPETVYDFGDGKTDNITQAMTTPGRAIHSSIEDTLDRVGRNNGR